MRNLRIQLLFSHLLLVLLMVVIMLGAVANFFHLGHSIERIKKNNYDSVMAAVAMKETLERQDSAAGTFFLSGQIQKARAQYEDNKQKFILAYQTEAHNITEPGEQEMVYDIGQYPAYNRAIERLLYARPPLSPQQAPAYYNHFLLPAFLRLKQRAQDVLILNQNAILNASVQAQTEARRASYTGIGVTAGAFLLAMVLALWNVRAALMPLRALARQAEEIGVGHLNQRIELQRNDEIGALAISFNHMAERLREARRLEEERLHRAERMSDVALESLYDPVIVTDAAGRVVHLNCAAQGLFGPEEQAKYRPVARVARDTRIAEAVEHVIHQERVSAAEGEAGFVGIKVGEAQRTYRLRATPMREEQGNMLGAVVVLEDVTRLRELDQLKTQFIGVASHELRTPVTSLLLSVQLLQEGAVGKLTAEQQEVIAAQREDLERLQRLMRDLLDITRLEAGVTPPHFESVPPRELVEAAVQAVAAQAEAKGVTLTADAPVELHPARADRAQITRVLVNLLNNAIRHTPAQGSVTVTARNSGREGANGTLFTVRDTGSGIPREYLTRIFDRFVQVPGATRGGAGLGLSIVRTIVQAHGGDVKVESEPNKGSVFTVTLPNQA